MQKTCNRRAANGNRPETNAGRQQGRAGSQTRGSGGSGCSAQNTKDLEEIRAWAEARGGKPSTVKATRGRGKNDGAGILRIDFPGYSGGDSLEEISGKQPDISVSGPHEAPPRKPFLQVGFRAEEFRIRQALGFAFLV